MSLRKEIIKIALAHPETREHLVPLLKQGSHIENREITITTSMGNREVMLNVFHVGIHRPEQLNRPDTRWAFYNSELKTKMTEDLLRKWVAWEKQGMTTKELREIVRNEYILKGDIAVGTGGMKRVGSAEKVKRAFLKLALKQEAFKHIMGQGGKLGILSAYGGDAKRSKKENQQRHGQLVADLQKMGYRKWETMKGSWEGVAEKALLVPNMKPEDLFELGKKYGQDSVIYKSEKGIVGMYYPKSKKVEVAVDPKSDPAYAMAKDKSEYSKTRNWSFSFDFLWGKDIPWDGHSVVSHDDVRKQLGIGKEKGESLDTKHKPGEVWRTEIGNWRAMNNEGKAESFKDKGKADQYAH